MNRLELVAVSSFLVFVWTSAAAAEVLANGVWTPKNYEIAGGWSIVTDGDERFVELDESFKTRKAPDLKIFLSPLPLAELTDDNATQGSVLVAPLESHQGAARYPIGPAVDLSAFETVIVHCQQYSKLWAGAPLTAE